MAGTARSMDKRSLLATCEYERFDVNVDVDTVTYRSMILNHVGELELLAITPTGHVINCSTYGVMSVNGPRSRWPATGHQDLLVHVLRRAQQVRLHRIRMRGA